MDTSNSTVLDLYVRELRAAKYSEETISDRRRVLRSLAVWLDDGPLLAVTTDDLLQFQAGFGHLAPASVDIYTRHVRALYRWARKRRLIDDDPSEDLPLPRLPRGRPHPAHAEQLRTIFACTPTGPLRLAYVEAAFVGLRRCEICGLCRNDLELDAEVATALIRGKGGRERVVPLLAPVVEELLEYGLPRTGQILRTASGAPYRPDRLSLHSLRHLREIGVETTLHSLRHTFATQAYRTTRDPLFVRDLLGHASVKTMEIYADPMITDAHGRLASVAELADGLLAGGRRPVLLRKAAG